MDRSRDPIVGDWCLVKNVVGADFLLGKVHLCGNPNICVVRVLLPWNMKFGSRLVYRSDFISYVPKEEEILLWLEATLLK